MTAANIIQKIVKNFKSELRVSYLGVELHAVYFLFFVFISCYRAGFRFAVISKPDGITLTLSVWLIQTTLVSSTSAKFQTVFCNRKVNFAVFGLFRGLNIAADHPRNKLTAVAYAEYGYSELQNLFCVVRRTHIKHGVGSAGKIIPL